MTMSVPSGSTRRAAVPPLTRLTAALDRIACRICVALFVAILTTMVLQVTFRYVLATPLTWTEELARYLYIWACWLGAPVALRRGNHIAITVGSDRLPPRLGRAAALGTQALALVFLAQLTLQGTILTVKSHTVDAITLPIPWSVIYVAAPISAVLMILETVRAMWLGPVRRDEEVRV
jgi:TRAP-type C4-dicarboxylate transport system permease small subunit